MESWLLGLSENVFRILMVLLCVLYTNRYEKGGKFEDILFFVVEEGVLSSCIAQ